MSKVKPCRQICAANSQRRLPIRRQLDPRQQWNELWLRSPHNHDGGDDA